MKSFTKLLWLMAMLVSVGLVAQDLTPAEQYQNEQAEQQRIMELHGPTVEVPIAPEGSGRATGDDCSDPIVIDLGTALPYSTSDQTCGRGNTYSNSCMGSYDGGEDIHYALTVPGPMGIQVTFNPGDSWNGIAIKDACGDGGTCLVNNTSTSNTTRTFTYSFTAAGTYYIMIDTWPNPTCLAGFTLDIVEWIPPPPADPITAFPFIQDFEDCTLPTTMEPKTGDRNTVFVNAAAAYESSCGIQMAGVVYNYFYYSSNCQSGMNYNIPPAEGGTAYGSYGQHWSKVHMDVRPDGTAGSMQLDFDFQQFYSYSQYYNAFQVWINGVPVMEKSLQEDCFRTSTGSGSGWSNMVFDLAPWQNDPQFDLDLVFIGAYGNGYGSAGDMVYIDNLQLWYVPSGDIHGVAYEGNIGNTVSGVEIGFLGDTPPADPVFTDQLGSYMYTNIPVEPIDLWPMYAFLDGQNYVEMDVLFVNGMDLEVNWNVSSPLMVISPVVLEETMNPEEWRSVPISIVNGGDGPLHWTAAITFGEPPTAVMVNAESDWSSNKPVTTSPSDVAESLASPSNIEVDGSRDISEYMDCSMEEPLFSAPPTGTSNGQAFESFYGWTAGQHFTLNDDKAIGFLDFWCISTGGTGESEIVIEFHEDGGTPGAVVSSFTAFLTPLPTGEYWGGAYQFLRFSVELPEGVDLEAGWVTLQRQNAGAPNPFIYWANTTSTSEPSWHSAGASVGPYATCLGGGAGGGWLDLSAFEGDVAPNGGSGFVNALFDAAGTEAGQVWTADILFTAQPNVGSTNVDVSMIIAGDPLVPIDDFTVELVNPVTGQVNMAWTAISNDITFEYYLVRRDGAPIVNTQNTSYVDYLPDYGDYCYTVSAVYSEGESTPAGPECVSWFIPEMCWSPDPLFGAVWINTQETFTLTIENCGEGSLGFEFTGFDDPEFSNGFVTSVDPYMGNIPEGEMMEIMVTYDATGYTTGAYTTMLDVMTNELAPDNERMVQCDMYAYPPAIFNGVVTDCDNGAPLPNVTVRASSIFGDYYGETNASGYYEVYVDAASDPWGAYFLEFTKLSYDQAFIFGLNISEGETQTNNVEMCEYPYPVNWVYADPNEDDDECMVTWSLPMGPYEIIYDDGTAENYFAWIQAGGTVGVRFTPAGYPATVAGGRLYVGDGSFPEGAQFLGAPISVGIMDDDGPNGMPGTVLDSSSVIVSNYGWVDFPLNGTTFNDGNFYIVYWQLGVPPFAAPVGVDEQVPTVYRSYTRQAGADWMQSTYNDFMIRATVFGPGDNVMAAAMEGEMVTPQRPLDMAHISAKSPMSTAGTVKGGQFMPLAVEAGDRDLERYQVAFVTDFDPNMGQNPMDGTLNILGQTTNNFWNDNDEWPDADPGFYAYAVRARYESSDSEWAYSNVVGHLIDNEVTINVTQCDGEEPSGAAVNMMGNMYPFMNLNAMTPASGTVVFDSVINGRYDLTITKLGYQTYVHNDIFIFSDYTEDAVLLESIYPPRNLYVDPLSSVATWDEPLYIQIPFQGFEDEVFPPAGWQMVTTGIGWERTDNGSSTYWTIPSPPEDQGDYYAVSNDDQSSGNDQTDYLITPELDLREAEDYALTFKSYYDGAWGQPAPEVVYSLDGGANWETLLVLAPAFEWTAIEVDIAALSGADGEESIWFAFYAYDAGWNSGWAIDNVYLGNGPVEVQGYHVFIEDGFVTATDADTRTYQYEDLVYGQVYEAAVAALYGCNISDKIYYTFTSGYLYPPRNLYDEYIYNTNEVPLYWNPPVTGDGVPMIMSMGGETMELVTLAPDNRTYWTEGEKALRGEMTFDLRGLDDSRDDLNIAIVSSNGAGNNFSEISAALMALGIENIDIIPLEPTQPTVDELLEYDALLFGLNTFFLIATDVVGDLLADYIDAGGKMVMTSPINATGYPNLPIGGRLLDEGYYAVTTAGIAGGNPALGDYDPDHPIMDGVTSASGGLTIGCAVDADAEEVALYNSGAALVAHKESIVHVNAFIAAPGYWTGDMDLIIYNALHFLQGGVSIGVPEGLMSFNIYQDDMWVGNKLYEGEDYEEVVSWVHNPVDPGCYDYTVTAVYDLAAYGFPGQTGESHVEGPDTVCVVWGMDLPFMETWDNGNFDFNGWRTGPENNWVVANAAGNPAPAAQFNWDPDPGSEYSLALTSAPLIAAQYTEGDIWFDFEYMLNNRNDTMTEKLVVEVYNGQDWMQVAEYISGADMDWTFQHIQITSMAMGRVFQVRFTAMGDNSFNIIDWDVDNIHIYRTCEAPTEFDGAYDGDGASNDGEAFGAEIWWTQPYIPEPPSGWIRWDDGINFTAVGLTDGGDFSVAARWDAGQLAMYEGASILKMQIFPSDDGFDSIMLKIWTGANASTLMYEALATAPIVGAWNDYDLDMPMPLDIGDELWIGYTVYGQPVGKSPAGTDEGPAEAGYGDKITTDGVNWDNGSDLGLNYNWNLAAWVETIDGQIEQIGGSLIDNSSFNNISSDLSQGAIQEEGVAYDGIESSREFTGFNIYRMGPGETEYTFLDNVAWVDGTPDYSYYDDDPFGTAGYPYTVCYQVTAVWESDTDMCESPPALSTNPFFDYVCIVITDVEDPLEGGVTNLYPNPATDRATVSSTQAIDRLTVVNYIGQVVYDSEVGGLNTVELNTASYDAGMYIVRISTESGIVTKRLAIAK